MIVLSYDCDSEYLKVLLSSKLCGNSNIKFEENISSSGINNPHIQNPFLY